MKIDTKQFMEKANASKTFEIHPVWLKHIQNLCDSHDELERKLREANNEIESLNRCKVVTDKAWKDLLEELKEDKRKLKIAEDALQKIENSADCEYIYEDASDALKQIRGEE